VCFVILEQVLANLAGSDPELLHWHLMRQHGRALKLCIDVLGEDPGAPSRLLPYLLYVLANHMHLA
jgi:hypothetical protein